MIKHNPFGPIEFPKKMIWTSSSLRLFRKCKRKFFWKYIMRLRPRTIDKNLAVGSAFHHAIADWYTGRRSQMTSIAQKYYKELMGTYGTAEKMITQEDADKFYTMVNTFQGMMIGYERNYLHDRSKWQTHAKVIEKQFAVDYGAYEFHGKIDLVVDDMIVDHKTCSSIRSNQFTRLPLDTQMRGYIVGAQKALKLSPKRFCYDVIKKCKFRRKSNEDPDEFNARIATAYETQPEEYFARAIVDISPEALQEFEFELMRTHTEYEQLKKFNDSKAFYPNDGACDEYFRECEFLPLCLNGLCKHHKTEYDQSENLHEELAEQGEE